MLLLLPHNAHAPWHQVLLTTNQIDQWHLLERENVPSLSPAKLSAPHWSTTAEGWKQETTCHEILKLQTLSMPRSHLIEHRTKQLPVSLISESLQERDVDRVTQTFSLSHLIIGPSAWGTLLGQTSNLDSAPGKKP